MSALPPDLKALKSTTHALIDAVGGSTAASVILDGKSASLIRSYGNINVPDRFMPLDDVMTLERHAQRPVVSAWLTERHTLDPDRPRRALSVHDLPRLAQECGDALSATAAALADGRVCAADRKAVSKELREAMAVMSELLDNLEEAPE